MDARTARGNDRMLRRVMALLVAFAALAERAAIRSAPVRFLVLWIVRRAETIAEAYVFEATGAPTAIATLAPVASGPADALFLAARLRALAAMLGALLPDALALHVRRARSPRAPGDDARPAAPRGPSALAPHDTS